MTRPTVKSPPSPRLLCADMHGRGSHADATLVEGGRADRGSVGIVERVVRAPAANDAARIVQVAG